MAERARLVVPESPTRKTNFSQTVCSMWSLARLGCFQRVPQFHAEQHEVDGPDLRRVVGDLNVR